MSRELWKKCATTDYSNPAAVEWVERYLPGLAGCLIDIEDMEAIYRAINVLEGLKLKYKLTENNLPLVALGPLSCLLGTN